MKGVKLNLETVNCVLLVVILALVIYCVVKQNEGFRGTGGNMDMRMRRGMGDLGSYDQRNEGGNQGSSRSLHQGSSQVRNGLEALDGIPQQQRQQVAAPGSGSQPYMASSNNNR
jgi:hypothetical protein